MLFLLINRTRKDLQPQEYETLQRMTADFYAHIPDGVRFHGDWNALDWSRNFTVLEADSEQIVRRLMEPYAKYVEIEVTPVQPTAYWAAKPVD